MKRFAWSLQRLLDVTHQREKLQREEVAKLAHEIAAVRRRIQLRRQQMAESLGALDKLDASQRLGQQELFMTCSPSVERELATLGQRVAKLSETRSAKMAELLKTRTRRQMLEKLRAGAFGKWKKLQEQLEQKQSDETGSIAFARRLLGARAAGR